MKMLSSFSFEYVESIISNQLRAQTSRHILKSKIPIIDTSTIWESALVLATEFQ